MKKTRIIILPIMVIIIFGIFMISCRKSDELQYNDDDAIGNSAGNLYNGGQFCEYNGRIYFSNPYDGDYLYSMNSDCSDIEKLREEPCMSINVCGKYIYYVKKSINITKDSSVFAGQRYGLVRCELDGSNSKQLYDTYTTKVLLAGNTLFYDCNVNATQFGINKVDISGDDEALVTTDNFDLVSCEDGKIYYSGTLEDHNIYVYDTATGVTSLFYAGNTFKASMTDGYLYYIDLSNGYALTKVNTKDNTKTVISKKHCINYNVIGITCFYQVEDNNSGLYRNNIYGTKEKLIMNGNISSIFATSQYTFFTQFGSTNLFRVGTFDGEQVETFNIGYE